MKDRIEIDIRVPNKTRYLRLIGRIGENMAKALEKYGGDREELAYHINLVLTESIANAMLHGNQEDPEKEVHISISIHCGKLSIKVFDQGTGFDISTLSPPCIEELDEHGRGIFIIRSLMDEVSYRRLENGNVLEMVKFLPEHSLNSETISE
ncbi:MAG: ATP-binding protein [Deltaproteobacteria bacterium]|nr:ATP-binding protein [Deltaproteobacteria bacterium]